MITIRTELRQAGDKGLGIFSKSRIEVGEQVWKRDPDFFLVFSSDQYDAFSDVQKEFFDHYGVREKNGEFTLDVDNTRFINHSTTPNVSFTYQEGIAIRVIEAGEELLCDYGEIYSSHHLITRENNSANSRNLSTEIQ